MTTLEEFKAASIGTVATNGDARAVKVTDAGGRRNDWVDAYGRVSYDDLACSDYTIIAQGPMSAREYLEEAWEAAYPVPEGAVIPAGTPYILRTSTGSIGYYAHGAAEVIPSPVAQSHRTLEPLPEPEPEWVKAKFIWADLGGERAIFERYADTWLTTGGDASWPMEEMAARNPVPVKLEGDE